MPVRDCKVLETDGDRSDVRFYVRTLKEEDLSELMEIRREMNIHDVRSCIQTWFRVDPRGIKIIITETGEMIGACCFIRNTDDFHFGGLYCVLPKFRGLGLGTNVWNACMDHVGDRNAGLNAVPGKMELYRDKGGFPIVEDEFKCVKNFTTEPVDPRDLSSTVPKDVTIEQMQDYHLSALFDYDYSIVGYDRRVAIALSCHEKSSRTYIALKNGVCVGFGTIKTTCLGAGRVGPLYADDYAVAEPLLKKLIMSLPNVNSFVMNTVSDNISAKKFLKKLGVPAREELTRMYRKEKLVVDNKKVFALFDLNLAPF